MPEFETGLRRIVSLNKLVTLFIKAFSRLEFFHGSVRFSMKSQVCHKLRVVFEELAYNQMSDHYVVKGYIVQELMY